MAGGDGSQAIVATIASELDLPYACIPSGTRDHFALDLGVDRDDVVGALDAFVDGGERRVDLGVVNGRVFVNNVSLGRLRRGCAARWLSRREAAHAARHDPLTPSGRRARGSTCACSGLGRTPAPRGRDDHGLEQPLPARAHGRLWNAARDRRRPALDHGCRGAPPGPRRAGTLDSAALARVDRADVRGRCRPTPSPPASTARRLASSHHCVSRSARGCCVCALRTTIRGPRRRRNSRRVPSMACEPSRK